MKFLKTPILKIICQRLFLDFPCFLRFEKITLVKNIIFAINQKVAILDVNFVHVEGNIKVLNFHAFLWVNML